MRLSSLKIFYFDESGFEPGWVKEYDLRNKELLSVVIFFGA
jgi:hypothetical protein